MKQPCHIAYILYFLLLAGITATAQQPDSKYDKKLADSLKADANGMKMYCMVILKTGINTTASQTTIDSLFNGHMQNIGLLAKQGKLIVAGPMKKNDKNYRGIFILNTASMAEASTLLSTDPAIKHQLLDTEIYGWYGSAALPMYLPYHQKIEKKK